MKKTTGENQLLASATQDPNFHRRKQIPKAMGARYLAAVTAVSQIIGGRPIEHADQESMSEFKGMVNRIIKNDQFDWPAVFILLGEPSVDLCKEAFRWAEDVRQVARAGVSLSPPLSDQLRADLAERSSQAAASLKELGFAE